MPPITIAQTASVTIQLSLGSQQAENVLCYRVLAAPVTAAKINDLATWWGSTGWNQYRLVLPAYATLVQIIVRSLDPALVYERVVFPTGTQSGNRPGDPIFNVTAPINWKSGTPTRSGKGRTSIGPVNDNDTSNETVGSALYNLLINLAAYLLVTHPMSEWELAVGSRKLHISYGLVTAIIEHFIGSMRSRLTRR